MQTHKPALTTNLQISEQLIGKLSIAKRSCEPADAVTPAQYLHVGQSVDMILITRYKNRFLHHASLATGHWCYDRRRSGFGWIGNFSERPIQAKFSLCDLPFKTFIKV